MRVKTHHKRSTEQRRWLHQYEIIGRNASTAKKEDPEVYSFEVFAPNKVVAKSRFWYYMNRQKKIKKTSGGEILSLREVQPKHPLRVHNYAIYLRARSKTCITNLTKEYRDTTIVGAVQQMYHEMAARHRCKFYDIQILGASRRKDSEAKREAVRQFLDPQIRFPFVNRVRRRLAYAKLFTAKVPTTFA